MTARSFFAVLPATVWILMAPLSVEGSDPQHSPAMQHHPEMHHPDMQHSTDGPHGMTSQSEMAEPGESISGALTEIVAALDADPATDWSRVNIDAVAAHLRQMNELFTGAQVSSANVGQGVRYVITGTPSVLAAAAAMAPAHAGMVTTEQGWQAAVEVGGESVTLTVTVADAAGLERLRALGFYGFLAAGSHHKMHHMMLARGMALH